MKHVIFTIADQGPFRGQLGRDRDSGRPTLSVDSDTLCQALLGVTVEGQGLKWTPPSW